MAIEKIAAKIRVDGAASVLQNGLRLNGSLPPLISDLLNIRSRIVGFARGQVNEELRRQRR